MFNLLGLAVLVAFETGQPDAATAPLGEGIGRENLLREPLEFGGREAIKVRVSFEPGAYAVRHSHPGAELVYVLKGELEYRLDNRPPVILKAGDVLFIPSGTFHSVRNIGEDVASELATYIVDSGRPLITIGH